MAPVPGAPYLDRCGTFLEAVMTSYLPKSPSGNDTEDASLLSLPCAGPAGVLAAARAEALFSSDVSACSPIAAQEVKDAIRRAVRLNGGVRGCAAQVAAAYGDYPETAAPRMRWARNVVDSVYGKSISRAHQRADGREGAPRRSRELDGVRSRAAGGHGTDRILTTKMLPSRVTTAVTAYSVG